MPILFVDKQLFVCDQCPHKFLEYKCLAAHITNVHTDKGPRKRRVKICSYCGKQFKRSTNYTEHVLAKHKNTTLFSCNLCHRSYGTHKYLEDHKKLVHERVRCEICIKEFCNSFILKRHKHSVHGILPENCYKCDKCPMFFTSQTFLDTHITSKHPEESQWCLLNIGFVTFVTCSKIFDFLAVMQSDW